MARNLDLDPEQLQKDARSPEVKKQLEDEIEEAIQKYEEVLQQDPDFEDARFTFEYVKKQKQQQQQEQNQQNQSAGWDYLNQQVAFSFVVLQSVLQSPYRFEYLPNIQESYS